MFTRYFLISMISASFAGWAYADGCCARCGCAAPCQKVCRLVCGEKKVEIICWGCQREDFCIPYKSDCGCKHCQTVCDTCGEHADPKVCSRPKDFVWYDWIPGCGSVHTRTKLMRRVDTVTVPSYRWVVEDLCPQCAANVPNAVPTAVAQPPTAPHESKLFGIARWPWTTPK